MKLYELAAEWDKVKRMLDIAMETGNEQDYDDAVIIASTIGGALDEKVENIACLIKELNADATAIKAEADALYKRAKANSTASDRLKSYLLACMVQADIKKVDRPRSCVSRRKSKALSVLNVHELIKELDSIGHSDCVRYKDPEIDKTAVKNLISSGMELQNAEIVENESVIIK